ncbi:MAG: hypothetical protein JXA78_13820 [Anaerolineales bacterium]|nr:hypothetical protein [Anaerolineales bacterium]
MNEFVDLLTFVMTSLQTNPVVRSAQVLESNQFSDSQFSLKVRAELQSGATFQVRLYQKGGHIDYSYQVFQDDQTWMRWDNKEHFSHLANHPHHFHTSQGSVETSALEGNPRKDLLAVLEYLQLL